MKLRVILSLIVVLFIGQSMCAMSTQILRRPIVLDYKTGAMQTGMVKLSKKVIAPSIR